MTKRNIALGMILFGCLSSPLMAADKKDGGELFEHHGCVNCHGADAKNPVNKVVPVLAGKSTEKVYTKAKRILSGKGATEASEIMHAAFYSPSQCDDMPTDAELRAIAEWISAQPI